MTTWHDVEATVRKHRDWPAERIADHLGCVGGYVRATAKRRGWKLPNGHRPDPVVQARNAALIAVAKLGDITRYELAARFKLSPGSVSVIVTMARIEGQRIPYFIRKDSPGRNPVVGDGW